MDAERDHEPPDEPVRVVLGVLRDLVPDAAQVPGRRSGPDDPHQAGNRFLTSSCGTTSPCSAAFSPASTFFLA